MSIPYNDTANKNGIIQLIEKNIGFNDGDISGNTLLMAQFTADVNLALDKSLTIIFNACGTWQFDDSNQTDYPIIKTAINSGQRDYAFTTDGSGNLVLDIYKVFCRISATGVYQEIFPTDVQSSVDLETSTFTDGLEATGIPYRYEKTANGIFLDPVPKFTSSDGLKVYINRETTYFTVSDTTKKAGIAGILHEYLGIKPAFQYAYRKSLGNTAQLQARVIEFEGDEERGIIGSIARYYSSRQRDTDNALSESSFNYR